MTKKDKGGPAFPVHPDMAAKIGCVNSETDAGMTLRDYFAAKALPSVLSSWLETTKDWDDGNELTDFNEPEGFSSLAAAIAEGSYAVADAMMYARKR